MSVRPSVSDRALVPTHARRPHSSVPRFTYRRAWHAARDLSRRAVPDGPGRRRSWLFLVSIGIPFAAGTLIGDPRAAVMGALVGMMCGFADEDERGLGARLLILAQIALGMLVGTTIGTHLRGYADPFWLVFGLALFFAGWLTEFGKGPHLAARYAAISLGLSAGFPDVEPHHHLYAALAVVVAGVVRTVDHLWHGAMPMPHGFVPPRLDRRVEWLRFAVAYALVGALGLWIGIALGMTRAIWITIAPLVVMQPGAEITYRRIVEFMFGTTIGVVVAWVLIHSLPSAPLVVIAIAIAPTIPLFFPHRFWLQTALIAVMLLIAFRLALPDPRSVTALIVERLEDIMLGCGLALVGAVMAFGRAGWESFRETIADANVDAR